MLKKAVEEFGDLGGIVFNRQTKQLVGGHMRVSVIPKSAEVVIEKEYDEPTRTGTVAEGYVLISGERFRYRQVDWPLAREEAANISANKQGGEWEDDKLREILADLVSQGMDMDLVGFTTEELEKLMGSDSEVYDAQCDEDEVGAPPVEPRSKLGDLYELGSHRLMCGDSTSIDAANTLTNGDKSDLVFTDPPYGVSYQNNMTKRFDVIENDDKVLDVAPVVYAVMKKDTAALVWTAQQVYPQWREQFASIYKSTVIWAKGGGGMGDLVGDFAPNYEMALFCTKGRPTFNDKRPMAVWQIGKDAASEYVHPTQKPVALAEYAISILCKDKGVVFDIFGGSGSTLIACEKTKRKCYMMELDPKYVDVIVSRYVKFSGNSKIKRNGEEIDWLKSE